VEVGGSGFAQHARDPNTSAEFCCMSRIDEGKQRRFGLSAVAWRMRQADMTCAGLTKSRLGIC